MFGSTSTTEYLRPTATDRVRLTVGDRQIIATVLEIHDGHIKLDAGSLVFGDAIILFSHPKGVVELSGTLTSDGEGEGVIFTIQGQRRREQRRGAFRLAVSCPVHITRGGGERLEHFAGDLSITGMRIMHATALADEEVVDLEIVLENGDAVQVRAQVVRRDERSVGVTFRDVSSAIESQLGRFVLAAQRARMRARN
jgi:hypothetical protein